MKTKLLLILLLLTAKLNAQIPADAAARLNKIFDSLCTKYSIKGASAAMFVPGVGIWKSVHGISHANTPITENMILGLGSNTKTYIAVLMLQLQEEGKLSLDDTIGNWIKNVQHVNGKITIRQMLNHTSGLYSYTENMEWINEIFEDQRRVFRPDEILKYIQKPKFEPGKRWSYCNTNYLLAGMIIEKVTGKPLHIVLREKMLSPHGLHNTYLVPDEASTAPFAHPWTYIYDHSAPIVDIMVESETDINAFYSSAYAAGALFSTAEDNALFWHKLMAGLIISEKSLAELKQYIKIDATVGYGLGIFREKNFNGRTVYSHGGTGFGYVNENIADSTNGIVITVLTNQDSIGNGIILNTIIKALHKATQQNQTLGINKNTAAAELQISVYPNPSTGNCYVKLPEGFANNSSISVVNMLGQEMMFLNNVQAGNEIQELDLTHLEAGMYVIRIKNKDNINARKIQVIK